MKVTILSSILLLSSISLVLSASGTCTSSISAVARSGASWTAGGVAHQIYDITVYNTGSCEITSLYGLYGFPSPGEVIQAWNYNQSTGEIFNFAALQTGQSATAGFVLAGGVSPSLAFNRPKCPSSCAGSSNPTVAPTATPAPSAGTSCGSSQCSSNQVCVNAAPGGPSCYYRLCSDLTCGSNQICLNNGGVARCVTVGGSCSVGVTINARAGGSFLANAEQNQIYDLEISNTGNQVVSTLTIEITPAAGTHVALDNKWNLVYWEGNKYNVSTYGALSTSASIWWRRLRISRNSSSNGNTYCCILLCCLLKNITNTSSK